MRNKYLPLGLILLCLLVLPAACRQSGSEQAALHTPSPTESSRANDTDRQLGPQEVPPKEQIKAITPSFGGAIAEQKGRNRDVVGWLQVPGTDVDHPIVQHPDGDNGFYAFHDFDGNPDKNGTYFADTRCDFTSGTRSEISRNISLYAHNFSEDPDGEFFAQLKKYKDPAFAQAHPYLFFSTGEEDMVWEVFAVYDTTVNFPYIIPDMSWAVFSEVLSYVYDASIYDYGITVEENDKILTLSTCSFVVPGAPPLPLEVITDYRFVVMARLVDPGERIKGEAAITPNSDPLPPDAMPMIQY